MARLATKHQTGVAPAAPLGRYFTAPSMARLYFMRHGPFLARLVFSNEKALHYTVYIGLYQFLLIVRELRVLSLRATET